MSITEDPKTARPSPLQRAIIMKLSAHPQTAKEIADKLGLNVRSVASTLVWMRGARMCDDGAGFKAILQHGLTISFPKAAWYDERHPQWVLLPMTKLRALEFMDALRDELKGMAS